MISKILEELKQAGETPARSDSTSIKVIFQSIFKQKKDFEISFRYHTVKIQEIGFSSRILASDMRP